MKFLLTSSGITNKEIINELEILADKRISELDILFIPTAANTEGGDKSWLINNLVAFQNVGFKSVDILDIQAVSQEIWQKRFREKDVICFGGGNEKYLAEVCDALDIKNFLTTLPDKKVYMGISAGSMVACTFMPNELYPEIFPEEDFGNINKEAMQIHSFSFIPHLNSSFFSHIRKENLEALKEKFSTPVYALDDETALSIDGDSTKVVGSGESWVYSR